MHLLTLCDLLAGQHFGNDVSTFNCMWITVDRC